MKKRNLKRNEDSIKVIEMGGLLPLLQTRRRSTSMNKTKEQKGISEEDERKNKAENDEKAEERTNERRRGGGANRFHHEQE